MMTQLAFPSNIGLSADVKIGLLADFFSFAFQVKRQPADFALSFGDHSLHVMHRAGYLPPLDILVPRSFE